MRGVKPNTDKLSCRRCGHQWYPRIPEVRLCPKCKSFYWCKDIIKVVRATKWYVCVTKPEHPRANKIGHVKRAVLVAEEKIGRYLLPEEEVHHINGIKTDDRPENLLVLTHREHRRVENNFKLHRSAP